MFHIIILAKCVLSILELNNIGKSCLKILIICHQVFTLPTQLHNNSFHVVERTRMALICTKMENVQNYFFLIVKFVALLSPSSSCCLSSLMVGGKFLLGLHYHQLFFFATGSWRLCVY